MTNLKPTTPVFSFNRELLPFLLVIFILFIAFLVMIVIADLSFYNTEYIDVISCL